MSRPKVDEKDKRIVQVNIRLTTTEASTVNEHAKSSGISPANWIRVKVFTGKFPTVKASPLDAAVYYELKKVGVNLNQAAHKLNQGEFPKDFHILQLELVALLNTILKQLLHDRQHDQG